MASQHHPGQAAPICRFPRKHLPLSYQQLGLVSLPGNHLGCPCGTCQDYEYCCGMDSLPSAKAGLNPCMPAGRRDGPALEFIVLSDSSDCCQAFKKDKHISPPRLLQLVPDCPCLMQVDDKAVQTRFDNHQIRIEFDDEHCPSR